MYNSLVYISVYLSLSPSVVKLAFNYAHFEFVYFVFGFRVFLLLICA